MYYLVKVFLVLVFCSGVAKASETQKLLDELAMASSAEIAKTITLNIQTAWIKSHKDPSEERLMTRALSAMDSGNLVKAEKELTKLIIKNPDFV